ncbi:MULTISPECIES: hypothetical protein [Lentibacter]|jgi:hypothetical protein|uniref:hypothetical protein n=1 Tax=Lentibacter TaxID=1434014 RepID=UPI000B800D78|nr:hypothetical protein [Lentibacter algarum]MCO4776088.1 hypothetical protein [Lentibacter algarum]MCO4828083.1 hypothetical protein [Lentibacter algarum]
MAGPPAERPETVKTGSQPPAVKTKGDGSWISRKKALGQEHETSSIQCAKMSRIRRAHVVFGGQAAPSTL